MRKVLVAAVAAGAVLIVVGVACVFPPLAFIVAGLILGAVGLFADDGGTP